MKVLKFCNKISKCGDVEEGVFLHIPFLNNSYGIGFYDTISRFPEFRLYNHNCSGDVQYNSCSPRREAV